MIRYDKWLELKKGHSEKACIKEGLFYYYPGDGNGDLLYNTARKIIETGDTSVWANHSLEFIFLCLDLGVRWPVHMNKLITLGEERRHHMTQDPWLLAYSCAVHLGRLDLIERYKPSLRIFNLPDKWAWRRALLGKRNAYWLWRIITPHRWMQHFVYVFYGFMEKAYLSK